MCAVFSYSDFMFFYTTLNRKKVYFLSGSEVAKKLGIDLSSLGLDASTVSLVESLAFGFIFLPLENMFNGNDPAYQEEICVKTSVDGLLYSVSIH